MTSLSFAPECGTVYEELKIRRKHRFIVFKMDDENTTVSIEQIGARSATFTDFKAALPERDCRYGIFDHEFMTDRGVLANKLWLVCWIPFNSTTHKKMQLTAAKRAFMDTCLPGSFECQAASLEELEVNMGLAVDVVEKEEDFDF